MRYVTRSICVLAFVMAAAGCGGKRTEITGTVTRDGKPLELDVENGHFIVIFVPEGGGANSISYPAETDAATGTFRISEIRSGTYIVAIHLFNEKFQDQLGNKYDPHYSPLRVEVNDDGQVIDIDIPLKLPE